MKYLLIVLLFPLAIVVHFFIGLDKEFVGNDKVLYEENPFVILIKELSKRK